MLGSFQTLEGAYDVAVAGNYAYVVTGRDLEWTADSGLEVIDVSNPAQPQRVGLYRTSIAAARITLRGHRAYVISGIEPPWRFALIPAGDTLQVFDVSDPANPVRVDKGNLPSGSMADVAVANGHLFLPKQGIYRIDEVPAIGPTLSMKRDRNPRLLDLWVQSPGFDDFTLMTSTTVTNWQPYATVFSRVENFRLVRDSTEPQNEPARFYQAAGEVLSPAAMSLQWKAAGIPRYRFRFERSCFCSPKVLSGVVTVENGAITRVDDAQGGGVPVNEPNLDEFKSIEGLFGLLHSSRETADLMMIKRDAERHFPTWIYINWDVQISDGSVTYRVTDLIPIE